MIKLTNFVFLLFFGIFFSTCADASNLNPKKILDSVDDVYRSNASHGILTLTVTTTNWQRTLTLEQWSKGNNMHLIKILKPKKEKDLATLRVDNNVWNYMPKVKRVVKIPSSMMSSSWMGSHFTNDDLVKQSRMVIDYDFSITYEGLRDGVDIVEISCIPKKNAAVVWGKVEVIVYRNDFIPLSIVYYDEDLKLSRTLKFSNIQVLGGKKIPLQMKMVPIDEPDPTGIAVDSIFRQGSENGGATFARLEGTWYGNGRIYIVSTSGGELEAGQVWEYDPTNEQLRLIYESPSADILDMPDNLCVSPRGGLILCEDGPTDTFIRGLTTDGTIFPFAKNNVVLNGEKNGFEGDFRHREFAGATFSADGRWLFFNAQTPGITFGVTGPWTDGVL